ncbi:MAG: hypothetical protein N2V77_06875 [Canidatus Methanoxibalbensis ujae]|nr:hypothetical protein [Candidatus Methanoxibalbensis ujae]
MKMEMRMKMKTRMKTKMEMKKEIKMKIKEIEKTDREGMKEMEWRIYHDRNYAFEGNS